jgi:predicted ribonuclease toxin of YeeF-YezG toxin-antitoxin module
VQAVDNTYEASAWSNVYLFNSSTVNLKSENTTKEVFTLFPNPSKSVIYISGTSLQNICIYNEIGEVVYSKQIQVAKGSETFESIDASEFARGLYFIRCNQQSIKFIKE